MKWLWLSIGMATGALLRDMSYVIAKRIRVHLTRRRMAGRRSWVIVNSTLYGYSSSEDRMLKIDEMSEQDVESLDGTPGVRIQ